MSKKFQNTIDFYNQNAKSYSKKILKHPPITEINKFTQYLPQKAKILDVGCAAGRDTALLTQKGLSVTGIDLSQNLLQEAQLNHPHLEFILMDMRQLKFKSNLFDGLYASNSIIHFSELKDVIKSLSEFNRVLKPKGILHLRTKLSPKIRQKTAMIKDKFTHKHYRFTRFFSQSELVNLVKKAGFTILETYIYHSRQQHLDSRDLSWLVVYAKKENNHA